MFDVSAGELLVIGAVALVVIGPKELPGMLRTVGQAVGKMKRMAGEFRTQFDDAMREADMHEVKKSFDDTVNTASAATSFNPLNTIRNEFRSTVDEIKAAGQSAEASVSAPVANTPVVSVPADVGPPVSVMAPPEPEPAFIPPAPVDTPPVVAEAAAPAKPKRRTKKTDGETA